MSFPWQTEKALRKQERDEDYARRAIAGYHRTMADILRDQLDRDRLWPATRKAVDNRGGDRG